jgi:hypothetical protein
MDFLPPGMRCVKEVHNYPIFAYSKDESREQKKLDKFLQFNKNSAILPTIVKDLIDYLEINGR